MSSKVSQNEPAESLNKSQGMSQKVRGSERSRASAADRRTGSPKYHGKSAGERKWRIIAPEAVQRQVSKRVRPHAAPPVALRPGGYRWIFQSNVPYDH